MSNLNNQEVKETNYSGVFARLFVLLFFIAFILYMAFIFVKSRNIYLNLNYGKNDIEMSFNFLQERNFSEAAFLASRAKDRFSLALSELEVLNKYFVVKEVPFIKENVSDLKSLIKAAELISVSVDDAFLILMELNDVISGDKFSNFLDLNEEERYRILTLIYENSDNIANLDKNVLKAIQYLDEAIDNSLLSAYRSQMEELKSYLIDSSTTLSTLSNFSLLIPSLTGYPESANYLILLQNHHELRPTGGFIGSYGILEMRLGDIYKLETHDIYHLDMPASLNKDFQAIPPWPIRNYLGVDRWFMRDANWSPDFPTAAKEINWFYKEEMLASGRADEIKDFSAIIAITPRIITDLLFITGPVEVDGVVYDKDNFMDSLQYEVEMAFREDGISEWERKNVIADIVKEIELRLRTISSDQWPLILSTFNENIVRKDILVYILDDEYRELAKVFNWDGSIKKEKSDFVMLVDTNLAAFKTDRVMDKYIFYSLVEGDDKIESEFKIRYKHNGWFDWQTTRYRSYTRLYTPYASSFVSGSGLSDGDFFVYNEEEMEFPKVFFGAFISIEPQDTKELNFKYILPSHVKNTINWDDYYSLIVQKQPGSEIKEFKAHLKFKKNIAAYKGMGDIEIVNRNEIIWTHDLDYDYELEIIFK